MGLKQLSSSTGVGKVRPAGQIQPADAFCPARGVVNSTLPSYFIFHVKIRLGALICYKMWPKWHETFLKSPADRKNCPPPI